MKRSTEQAAKEMLEDGTLDISAWDNHPPAIFLTIDEDVLDTIPSQVFVLTVKRKDGKECRFHLAIGEQATTKMPTATVRSCKTKLGSDNNDADTVKTLAGRFIDYRRDEDKPTA